MSCEICGKSNCTKSFHSIEEQTTFDDIADSVKDKMKECLIHRIERLDGHYHGDNFYLKLENVIKTIEDYY